MKRWVPGRTQGPLQAPEPRGRRGGPGTPVPALLSQWNHLAHPTAPPYAWVPLQSFPTHPGPDPEPLLHQGWGAATPRPCPPRGRLPRGGAGHRSRVSQEARSGGMGVASQAEDRDSLGEAGGPQRRPTELSRLLPPSLRQGPAFPQQAPRPQATLANSTAISLEGSPSPILRLQSLDEP